jgi:hypothetical protein
MPARYIREAFLDSDTVARAGEAAEVMFFRLMLVVDDFGRFDGRVAMICRKCWPLGKDSDPQPEEVERRLERLDECGLIQRYEIDGKPYISIPKFKQRTRSPKSKFPEPPSSSRQPADIPPSLSGQAADDPPTDGGHMTAPCPPRTSTRSRSSTRSLSNPISISSEARTHEETDEQHTPRQPEQRATPPTGESPSEFYRRHTKPDPFADSEQREGSGT